MEIQTANQSSQNEANKLQKTKVRFIVNDTVKAQVVDPERDKVIREIPPDTNINLFDNLYA